MARDLSHTTSANFFEDRSHQLCWILHNCHEGKPNYFSSPFPLTWNSPTCNRYVEYCKSCMPAHTSYSIAFNSIFRFGLSNLKCEKGGDDFKLKNTNIPLDTLRTTGKIWQKSLLKRIHFPLKGKHGDFIIEHRVRLTTSTKHRTNITISSNGAC